MGLEFDGDGAAGAVVVDVLALVAGCSQDGGAEAGLGCAVALAVRTRVRGVSAHQPTGRVGPPALVPVLR